MIKWIFTLLVLFLSLFPLAIYGQTNEDVRPDGTISETNTDCTTSTFHTATDEEIDDTSTEQCDCTDDGTDVTANLNFANPTANPTTTTDAQVMAVEVKKCIDGTQNDPSFTIQIECGATTLVPAPTNHTVTSATETTFTQAWTFNTTDCASDGSDVEVVLNCSRSGGSPASRRSCTFTDIEWRAEVSSGSSPRRIILTKE